MTVKDIYNKKFIFLKLLSVFLIIGFLFQNCSKIALEDAAKSQNVSSSLATPAPQDLNVVSNPPSLPQNLTIDPVPGFVCSPFGVSAQVSEKSGLKTELRYLKADSKMTTSDRNKILSVDYFADLNADIVKTPETIYLNEVNIPTRSFLQGFTSSNGSLLQDDRGQTLIEYFALKMESILKLGPNDLPGYYELATLSDDGTVLQIKDNNSWSTLISNDGAHSTQMGCVNRRIYLDQNSRIPIRIFYNQGPREKIANVLVWNYRGLDPITAVGASPDSQIHKYCGQSSDDNFWFSATSQPNTWIKDLFSSGWKIIAPVNFQLPDDAVNPCAFSTSDVVPVISSELVAGKQIVTVKSQDQTQLSARLFLVKNDVKVLVKIIDAVRTEAASTIHTLDLGLLESQSVYELELTLEISSRSVKVLRVFKITVL